MKSYIGSLLRPVTPVSVRPSTVDSYLKEVRLRAREGERRVNHVHCTTCRDRMLPSMTGEFYCMLCRVTYSNTVSVSGILFTKAIGSSRAA